MKVKIRITGRGLTSLRAAQHLFRRGLARWVSKGEITIIESDHRVKAPEGRQDPSWGPLLEVAQHPEIVDAFPGMPVLPTFGYDRTGGSR